MTIQEILDLGEVFRNAAAKRQRMFPREAAGKTLGVIADILDQYAMKLTYPPPWR